MQTKTRLILLQYREGSQYADSIGVRYHFPRKYYNFLTMPEIEFIYYEPQTRGKGVYFGFGEVGKIDVDPETPDHFYAEILNYRTFSKEVSGINEDGKRLETAPYYNAQNAVRQVVPEIFEEICAAGGIELNTLGVDSEKVDSDETITDPFDPSKIKVDRQAMTIFQVLRKIGFGEIVLNPDFQRNLVWDIVRRSRLIESALLQLPLPAFYFDGVEAKRWTVVDGLQRLSTLNDFMVNRTFRLQGLEYLGPAAEGKTFDELSRGMQRDLEDTEITIFVIRPETPPDVKFTIFYRINTGGLVLTTQEIRHALFQGHSTRLLKDLADSEEFLRATDYGVSDSRMDSRECILRYFAFRLHDHRSYEKSDLNGLLSRVMKEINGFTPDKIAKLSADFKEAMCRANAIFGRFAFRKYGSASNRRGPVNKALFESWANVLLDYDLGTLMQRKQKIISELADALSFDDDYSRSLSAGTGSVASVQMRFERAQTILEAAIND